MHELEQYLADDCDVPFAPDELNHIVLMVYNFLRAAVRKGCDTLRFTVHDVTWIRDGCPVGQFQESPLQTETFRAAMERIFARDEAIRRHLRPVAATPDEAIYRIIDEAAAPRGPLGTAGRVLADD